MSDMTVEECRLARAEFKRIVAVTAIVFSCVGAFAGGVLQQRFELLGVIVFLTSLFVAGHAALFLYRQTQKEPT